MIVKDPLSAFTHRRERNVKVTMPRDIQWSLVLIVSSLKNTIYLQNEQLVVILTIEH